MFNLFDIDKEIDTILPEAKEWKNHIHQNPELSMKEYNTSKFIYEKLIAFGIKDTKMIGDNAVIATIYGLDKTKAIAIRADIDALPTEEKTNDPFISKNIGVMHACGHDLHTAILLSVAKILSTHKDLLKESIRLIFQPGEEVGLGAKYIVKNGGLDGINISKILALHCYPDLVSGKILFKSGAVCASSDSFNILIKGKQGHGAHPHKAVDSIVVSAYIILAIQSIISREMSPLDSNVITLGAINAGTQGNIIPEEVQIKGTIRTLDKECRSFIHQRIKEIAEQTAAAHRASAYVEINEGIPSLINDKDLSKKVESVLIEEFGDNLIYDTKSSMGGEDFSIYTDKVPGVMFRLGCGYTDKDNYSLHSNLFSADNNSIITGVKTMTTLVFKLIN